MYKHKFDKNRYSCNKGSGMISDSDGGAMQEVQYYATQLSEFWQEKIVLSATLGTVATIFGIAAPMLMCISVLMIVDLMLGIFCAWVYGELSLEKLRRGSMKFLAYYLSMFLVSLINDYVSLSVGISLPIQNLYVTYLITTETVSIMSHCNSLGMPFPPLFQTIIKGYKNKVEHTVESMVDDEHNSNNDKDIK